MATRSDPHKTPAPDKPHKDAPKTEEERIDESLEESFPASDPPAIHTTRK